MAIRLGLTFDDVLLSILRGVDELRIIIRTFIDNGVRFTVNTDGPEMYKTSVLKEEELLLAHDIMTEAELETCMQWAFEGAFVRPRNNHEGKATPHARHKKQP